MQVEPPWTDGEKGRLQAGRFAGMGYKSISRHLLPHRTHDACSEMAAKMRRSGHYVGPALPVPKGRSANVRARDLDRLLDAYLRRYPDDGPSSHEGD